MMTPKTKKIEDLFDITPNLKYVVALERAYFSFAERLAPKDYNGGQWESKKLGKGWYFLLDDDSKFSVYPCQTQINNKVFSFLVNHSVFLQLQYELEQNGLEQDPLSHELYCLWVNLNTYFKDELTKKEQQQFYEIMS
mgnify:CR=1 FL=1